MSISEDLLIILTDYTGGYRLMRARNRGYTGPAKFLNIRKNFNAKNATISNTLYRLQKRGFVERKNDIWHVTQKGIEYLGKRMITLKKYPRGSYDRIRIRKKGKDMVIAFDVPEKYRKRRSWLRMELDALGFAPLQKSVWFGPAPLPKEFVDTLGQLNVLKYMKFFEAKQREIV